MLTFCGLDTSGNGSDYTSLIVCEKSDKRVKVLKVWRDNKLNLNERLKIIETGLEEIEPRFVAIESNSMGCFYIEKLKESQNILSVSTNRKTKPRMIDLIKYYLERQLLDLSSVSNTPLIDELIDFSRLRKNKLGATGTKNDDCVMALAVALYGLELHK